MPRKAYVEDLQQAIESFTHPNVAAIRPGLEDGSLTFDYSFSEHGAPDTAIHALVTDVGDYPSSHMYMIYTTSENVPSCISTAIEDVGTLDGFRVGEMLSRITKLLDKATTGSQLSPFDLDHDAMDCDDADAEPSEAELDEESEPESIDVWSPKSPDHPTSSARAVQASTSRLRRGQSSILARNQRIRSDLRATKDVGFRVGHLGGLLDEGDDCFVTISIRVSKLGISEEAMQAWHLDPNQYFVLLIRYPSGYQDFDALLGSSSTIHPKGVSFRVGLSYRYKIPIDEAIEVFSQTKRKAETLDACDKTQDQDSNARLQPCFIGSPLQDLMNDRLLAIINYRLAFGFGWKGAEAWYTDHQGSNWSSEDSIDSKYYSPDISSQAATLPKIVTDDHISKSLSKPSFPLAAAQFALRHLVRCTEFCLVCHSPVEDDFEALKPYVCSKPLCLYQYMAFGFGPSIEHDIISQPHVVDLLISFCYASAAAAKLKNLPYGLSLSVPAPNLLPSRPRVPTYGMNGYMPDSQGSDDTAAKPDTSLAVQPLHRARKYKARFDQANMELILAPGETLLYPNQWVFITVPGATQEHFHCRIIETLHPSIRLGPPISPSALNDSSLLPSDRGALYTVPGLRTSMSSLNPALTPAATPPSTVGGFSKHPEVEFVIYDQNFDDLSFNEKQATVCTLLDTLPTVIEMKEYLRTKRGKDMALKSWNDRISPAAAGILRWIIASNRSCIVEVDHIEGETSRASEERVSGMSRWMQFRFAQGAPDKEQRFIQSIRDVTANAQYPTQYAWHGSPLHNWHSIVREGLHFQHAANGRAFGHGVYHATDVHTSLGYSMTHRYQDGPDCKAYDRWPHSQLKISQAVALNEIVNAPAQFVSSSPHLVVAQLDWIQTRYLFVKINSSVKFDPDVQPREVFPQDPAYTPFGTDRTKIVIPMTALSKSRRPLSKRTQNGDKKIKLARGSEIDTAIALSDDTDFEDLQILLSDVEERHTNPSQRGSHGTPLTDFVPGSHYHQTLPLLEAPSYATSMATKALQRELNGTLKIQDARPAHELGWYINRELISNMYQWIIELHSFESHLPLAKDLKDKNLLSVVMEVRFGKDYPMSPPFVRIIRPRFLSFMAGGGGHVTAGGALCMELLTNSGWSAVSNMESVLLQVRLALSSTDPQPARLEPGRTRDYGVGEAIEAYIRACHTHGDGSLPSKARDRRSSTPRKPLGLTTGNHQAHQISITTPELRKTKERSPGKSCERNEPSESPWHIRITVQAEQTDSRKNTSTPQCSPSKIFSERTFTTKVPLKDSDETSPVRRKVKGTPRNRQSSPAKARSTSRGRPGGMSKLNALSPTKDADAQSPSVPKRGRGRPRKSTIPQSSTSGSPTNEEGSNALCPKVLASNRTSSGPDLIENQMGGRDHEERRSFESNDELREFDSVIESEGFSMVSVSSLPSAQSASGNIVGSGTMFNSPSATPGKRHVTPSLVQHSPILPPPPKLAPVVQSNRDDDKSTTSTPRLARVVRAGIALQGVLSPATHHQGSRQPSSRFNPSSPLSANMSPKERLDDLFSGFGPGTQRELRAGLRLGEELAKRQNIVMRPDSHINTQDNGDVFNTNSEVRYPQLPDTGRASGYSLKVPCHAMAASPSFSNTQLPSPARSEVDADDDRMSWKFDTLPQYAVPLHPNKELSGNTSPVNGVSSPADRTMIEREAEWQRERDAVSRQIQDANSSQVIVINSDDEDNDDANYTEVDAEDDGDIWQEEAQVSQTSQGTSEIPPIFRQTEAPKPRRSQLPSPWMRKSKDHSEITSPTYASELLNPTGYTEPPPEQGSAQESTMGTPTHVANQTKQWSAPRSEYPPLDGAFDDNDPEASGDQELDSEDSFAEVDDLEPHLLSQQSMQHNTTGPLDEGTELDPNVTVSIIETLDEEMPEPQTPCPQKFTPRQKTPKQVRFSEEAIRPRPSELPAPEIAPLPPSQSSWFGRVASLLPSWGGTGVPAAVPLPSRPKRRIRLSEVDHGPLPVYMPWTKVHWWALIHIVRRSQADPSAYPYDSKMASARYLGSVVSVNGWSKTIGKQDCAVCERFLEALRSRGTLKGIEATALRGGRRQWGRVPGKLMDLDVVLSAVVSQWASDVQDGICTVGWGDRAGLRQGSETEVWTKADLPVDGPGVVYV
ncbi:MAG: hypothetical protein Q9216_005322 [Gyalolechia sp. 2 TL-2023]